MHTHTQTLKRIYIHIHIHICTHTLTHTHLQTGETYRSMHMARAAVEAREWHRVLGMRDLALDATRMYFSLFSFRFFGGRQQSARVEPGGGCRTLICMDESCQTYE